MKLKLEKSILTGKVTVPPSKSITHRAVICAALAEITSGGKSNITNVLVSDDIEATFNALKRLKNRSNGLNEIFCNESGSTLRFIIPIAAALGGEYIFSGAGRLSERPIDAYADIFNGQGLTNKSPDGGGLPFYINGSLKSGVFKLDGGVTSQYISGLLFALPLLEGDSVIEINGKLESKPYVDLTVYVLEMFGIEVESKNNCYYVKGNQKYKSADYMIEGDYSQAAFWEVAKGLGMCVDIGGLNENSKQGDKEIINIVSELTGLNNGEYTVDVSQIPDLVPAIAVMASLSDGVTRIVNAGRLRIKESDRLRAVSDVINKMGGDVTELADGLVINGKPRGLAGGCEISSYNDHRIAMSAAVAALKCSEPVILDGAECVSKSYPDFWDVYRGLGGTAYEFSLG